MRQITFKLGSFAKQYLRLSMIFLGLFISSHQVLAAKAQIISSEFLNQASVGGEGPQLVEVDLDGKRRFLLTYTHLGQPTKVVALQKTEFIDLQIELRRIVTKGIVARNKNETSSFKLCEKEIVYTKVDADKKVVNESICLNDVEVSNRRQIASWFESVKNRMD